MLINFLHIFLWFDSSFTFSTEKHSIVWIPIPTEGHLSYLQIFAIMKKLAINIYIGFAVDIAFQILSINTWYNC